MLSPDHDFRFMLVSQMQRDLGSTNLLDKTSALVALCKLVTTEMIPALLPRVEELLSHDQTLIRKKCVMALHRFHQLDPSCIAHLTERIKGTLRDPDPSVMSASLCLLHELARLDPVAHVDLVDHYVSILKQIIEHRLPRDFDYHRMPAPWIQIKLLQLMATLGANNKAASEGMYEVLSECMKRADTGTNVGFAIVYEAVRTVTTIWPESTLLDTAANAISRFITSDAYNLKYLGVTGLAAIVRDHPKYAVQHQMAVIDCLEDPDETLKRKTLELLFRMTNPQNAEAVVDKLLHFLNQALDPFLRADLVSRIVQLADRYAPSNLWFVDTMIQVLSIGGDLVNMEAVQNLFRLFAEGADQDDEDLIEMENAQLRRRGCWLLLESLRKPNVSENLVKCAFWTLGEYAYLLTTKLDKENQQPEGEDDEVRVDEEDDEDPAETEIIPLEEVLEVICESIDRTDLVNPVTKGYGITALCKITAQLGVVVPQVQEVINKYASSKYTELQQRCREFDILTLDFSRTRELFPVDASCEDFENVDFNFMDEFCEILRAAGASNYNEALRITNDADFGEVPLESDEMAARGGNGSMGLKFDAYEAPSIHQGAPPSSEYSHHATVDSSMEYATDEMARMSMGDVASLSQAPAASSAPQKPSVKSLWGPKGYMGGALPNQQQPSAVISSTTASSTMMMTPDYDFGEEAAEEQNRMSEPGISLASAPPPVDHAKKELTDKEKAAQALFGGLGATSSSSKSLSTRIKSSSTRSTLPGAAEPRMKKTPSAPPVDLFSMEADLLGFGTPTTSTPPAQSNNVLDIFSTLPPLGTPTPMPAPAPAPVVNEAKPQPPFCMPKVIDTAYFGSLWPSHSQEMRVSVRSPGMPFPDFIRLFADRIQVHLVEFIPATQEAIFAGIVPSVNQEVVLIHAKDNQLAGVVDLMVRSRQGGITERVANQCTNAKF